MDSATEIWKELKDIFYQVDIFNIYDIQEEICTLKQGDSFISFYYTKMKKLQHQIENFRPIPSNNCVENSHFLAKMRCDHVIRFLKGLNEQYSAVRSHIMLLDSLRIGIFYYLIIFQYYYVGKYRNYNYISYLSIASLN